MDVQVARFQIANGRVIVSVLTGGRWLMIFNSPTQDIDHYCYLANWEQVLQEGKAEATPQ